MKVVLIILGAILCFLIGLEIGVLYFKHQIEKAKVGDLNVDMSIPSNTYLFAELDTPILEVLKKDYVVMKVKQENYLDEDAKNGSNDI